MPNFDWLFLRHTHVYHVVMLLFTFLHHCFDSFCHDITSRSVFLQSGLQCCGDAGDRSGAGAGLFDLALRGGGHPLAPSLGVRTHGVDHFLRTGEWVRHQGDYVADAGTDDNAVVVVVAVVAVDDVADVVAVVSADGCAGGDHTSLWWLLLLGPVSCCCC